MSKYLEPKVDSSIDRVPGIAILIACSVLAAACSTTRAAAPATIDTAGTTAAVVEATPAVQRALESACYSCHSNDASAPWYGKLSPSYWFAGEALRSLNFSAWTTYDAKRRADEFEAIAKVVESGEMPPFDYRFLVSSSRLTDDAKRTLVEWAFRSGR